MAMRARFNAQNLKVYIEPELTSIAREHYSGDTRKAFRHWAFKEIFADAEFEDSDIIEKTRIDRSGDLGIDGWWTDEENRVLRLFQAKSSAGNVQSGEFDKLLAAPDKLETPAMVEEGNDHVRALAYEYRQLREEGWAVELVLASAGRITSSLRTRVDTYNNEHQDDVISCRLLGLTDLAEIYDKNLAMGRQKPQVTLQLLRRTYYELPAGPYPIGRTLVATLKATELVRAYDHWKDLIFSRNPRLYLGRNTQINRGIAQTIADENERSRFVNYNNGIRVICDKYELKRGRVAIHDFQVVNGCQTTVSLWHKRNSLDQSVLIDIKIIEANDEKYWHNISKFTNSQAALQPRNFVSDLTDQARLHEEFRYLPPGYFYEIRRGQWQQFKANNPHDAATFMGGDSGDRVLSVRHIAQTSLAFNGKPGEAKDETRYVFVSKSARGQTKSYYSIAFPLGITARELLLTWEVYRRVDVGAKQALKEADQQASQAESGQQQSKDHLLFGRFHTAWLMSLLLQKSFGTISPALATSLVASIDTWFPLVYRISRTALEAAVAHTRGQEGDRYTHRSFFREGRYYPVLEKHLLDEVAFNRDTRGIDVLTELKSQTR